MTQNFVKKFKKKRRKYAQVGEPGRVIHRCPRRACGKCDVNPLGGEKRTLWFGGGGEWGYTDGKENFHIL